LEKKEAWNPEADKPVEKTKKAGNIFASLVDSDSDSD